MERETLGTLFTLLIFLPLVGIPFTLALKDKALKAAALVFSLIPFALSLFLYFQYLDLAPTLGADGGYTVYKSIPWFSEGFGSDIKFIIGVDGISIYLVLLTTFLFPLSIYFSWGSVSMYQQGYYTLLLLLEAGVLGVFMSLDLIVFYIFFEVGLIPMYFLIGIWGSKTKPGGRSRIYAAVKFFLYTLVGSFIMLIGLLYLCTLAGDAVNGGVFTSDLSKVLQYHIPADLQMWLFFSFAISFLIKVPVFPVHTWLPDAHVMAPTAGSVILAGVLLKMGTYGLIRFCLPLFPVASVEFAPAMCLLGVIGIIYGAMAAMVQTDIKKLVAYSSVAHMGFIVLGIFSFSPDAMSGAVLQMINHGISTPALFFLVGMIYDRRHTREIRDYQGIAKVVPVFTLFFIIATMSSIGLPGFNGFVGEFLILLGSFDSEFISDTFAIISASGVIIAAVYMLWMFRRVMFGELDKEPNIKLKDLDGREIAVLLPLTILMFIIGFHATPFLKHISLTSDVVVANVVKAVSQNVAVALP